MSTGARKKVVESLDEEQRRIIKKASPALNKLVGSDFTLIDTNERKLILLRAAPHARQPSMLWTKDRKLTKKFYVKRFLEFHDRFECEFADRASRVLGDVDHELDLASTNEIYFNIRCEESTLFFHVNRRGVSSRNGLLVVKIPKELYEIQRRSQLRYRSNGSDEFRITSGFFQPWLKDFSVLDISSGGFCIQIKMPTPEALESFEIAREVRVPFQLDLGVFALLGLGEVRYLRKTTDEIDGSPVARIGLQFVDLPPETSEALQIFVLEKSYSRLREMFVD